MQQTRVSWSSVLRQIALAIVIALLLLTLGLWIKSYFRSDTFCWDYTTSSEDSVRRTQWAIQSRRGRIVLGRFDYLPKRGSGWQLGPLGGDVTGTYVYRSGASPLDWIGPTNDWGAWGFAWRHTIASVWPTLAYPTRPDDLTIVSVPHWAIVLPLGILVGLEIRRRRRLRELQRAGLCRHCGYDLRGITSARCPECGTIVDASTPSPLAGEGRGEG